MPGPTPRPQDEGKTSTSEALLASARRLFAERGFDGASIRAITRHAATNLGAVTYHFGSKKGLYEAVLDGVLSPLGTRVGEAVATPGTALERLEAVVRAFFTHLEANPDMPQLMIQEIAAGKEPPPPVRRLIRTVADRLAELVAEGQRKGEVRDGDPLLMGLSCIYQPIHLTLIRRMAHRILGLDPADPDTRERIVEHSVRFVRAGLEARRETTP